MCSLSFTWQPQVFFPSFYFLPSSFYFLPSSLLHHISTLPQSKFPCPFQFSLMCQQCIAQYIFYPYFCYSARICRVFLKCLLLPVISRQWKPLCSVFITNSENRFFYFVSVNDPWGNTGIVFYCQFNSLCFANMSPFLLFSVTLV